MWSEPVDSVLLLAGQSSQDERASRCGRRKSVVLPHPPRREIAGIWVVGRFESARQASPVGRSGQKGRADLQVCRRLAQRRPARWAGNARQGLCGEEAFDSGGRDALRTAGGTPAYLAPHRKAACHAALKAWPERSRMGAAPAKIAIFIVLEESLRRACEEETREGSLGGTLSQIHSQ